MRVKFFIDENRCIECQSCVVACKEGHELPVGVNRRRVVTVNEGIPNKEISVSVACWHCEDAPCAKICPVDCFYIRADGVVLHDKSKCIGCSYCLYACPFGAPQFAKQEPFGVKGKMDKCTFCAGGPEETHSEAEFHNYGQNRIAEGKVPLCAAMCSTKALVAGEGSELLQIAKKRVHKDALGIDRSQHPFAWEQAYGK
jgi:formate dehydrogenase iron-sulfur subunit